MEYAKEFGVIGLGRMGGNLARQALEKGMRVVGLTLEGAPSDLIKMGLVEAHNYAELARQLAPPRAVLLYIPAGAPVDAVTEKI